MPVQIGAKTHNFSDPTGFLSDHHRIEMSLRSLERAATDIDHPLTEEARGTLGSALHYFREAVPKHTADEEESLFPRLRQMLHPVVASAIEQLRPLEGEHRLAGALHAAVEELGQQFLATGSLSQTEADGFCKAVGSLGSMYKRHIGIEDDLVFPLATRLLPSADKATITNGMATRRKARFLDQSR
jgi:hemerythrin-like domain-containing protein